MLIKELVRTNSSKINQLILFIVTLFRPVTTIILWTYVFSQPNNSQLPSSPRTPGWRSMTSEDVPRALALINKWSSQFEIRQLQILLVKKNFLIISCCTKVCLHI